MPQGTQRRVVPSSLQARVGSHCVVVEKDGQQASALRPHGQRPPWQVPTAAVPEPHEAPLATHWLLKQQPPALQVLPAQQGPPGSPHRWQMPSPKVELQTLPAAQGVAPGQQGSPAPPQEVQVPARQVKAS